MVKKLEIKKGDQYGRLTIIKEVERYVKPSGKTMRMFLCECECGNKKNVKLENMRKGSTTSCGCYRKEQTKQRSKKHGMKGTKNYGLWLCIKARCNNKNDKDYKYYGGRGIKVERISFEDFYRDMGDRPKGMQIDRIDNNGNYSKANCRWATCKQQARNKRNNILYKGKCIAYRAEKTGINYDTIRKRIQDYGRTRERALLK